MVRSDFVSNSSSCSFFIYLQSKKDIDEFKKIFNKLFDLHVNITIHLDPNTYFDFVKVKDNLDNIKKGDYVKLDAGEDHCEANMIRYENMCDIVDSCHYKFKEFIDVDAHYTRGKKWKEGLDD